MGTHVDTRDTRKKVREHDELARRKRATFKQYLRNIEEDLLEDDLGEIQEEDQDADGEE